MSGSLTPSARRSRAKLLRFRRDGSFVVSFRFPNELRGELERWAAQAGLSRNGWVVRSVERQGELEDSLRRLDDE